MFALCAVAAFPLAADAKLSRTGSPNVTFTAIGPAGMKIVGTTSDLNVDDDGQNVTVVVPLANLRTGISLRDRHMKEKYLQVQQYPNAELRVARSALRFPTGGDTSGDAPGSMKIHGRTNPVTFHYVAHRNGGSISVTGSVHVNMKDYGIDVPSYLGVTVRPDVDVSARFDANDG